jgi:hypothetical protein
MRRVISSGLGVRGMTSNSDDVEARVMFWVLIGFLILAVIVGLALGLAFGWIPLPWNVTP